MAMVPLPWAKRRWGLPFLTVLAPSQRYDDGKGRRHKKLTDWARQGILQIRRWLPNRLIVVIADSSFSAIELIAAVLRHVCFVTRLRLDANLFEPPPQGRSGKRGRPPKKGRKLPKLTEVLADPATRLDHDPDVGVVRWERCRLDIATGTALWYHAGLPPVPIRWVLVRDPAGIRKPQAFLCTDLDATPAAILGWFVHRWSMETTFQETREHLGVETQRQWSDLAIARTTPALLGPLLPRHPLGRRRQSGSHASSTIDSLVRQGRADLQRRHRHRSTRALAGAEFIDIPEKPTNRGNSDRPLAKTH